MTGKFISLLLCAMMPLGAMAAEVTSAAGSLAGAMGSVALATETELTVRGSVDASDLWFISENMPALRRLDLSEATIAAYKGASLHGVTVSAADMVPAGVFAGSGLTAVELPRQGALTVGPNAFAGSALTSLTVPANAVRVAEGAFLGCDALTTVTVSGPAAIGDGAFAASDVTTLTFGAATTAGAKSFHGCTRLATLEGEQQLTAIGADAFAGCTALTDFDFGGALTAIGDGAFRGSGLQAVDLRGCTALTDVGAWAFADLSACTRAAMAPAARLQRGVFFGCPQLSDFTTSDGIEAVPDYAYTGNAAMKGEGLLGRASTIGKYALKGLSGVTAVTLPDNIEYLGDRAMADMTSLRTVNVGAAAVPELGDDVWHGVSQPDVVLYVPAKAIDDYKSAPQWREFDIKDLMSGEETVAIDVARPHLRGRFAGDELQVSVNGLDIDRLSVCNAAGAVLITVEPRTDCVAIATEGLAERVYIIHAALSDGRTASLKLSK